jgi:hypothetical protein
MDAPLRMQIPDWMTALEDCYSHERDRAQKSQYEADFQDWFFLL